MLNCLRTPFFGWLANRHTGKSTASNLSIAELLGLLWLIAFVSCTPPDSGLPEIRIITKKNIVAQSKRPCLIDYRYRGDRFVLSGKIKRRGGLSMRYPKWSFTLNLDRKMPLADLPTDDDWILTSNYIDKTFMRHKLAYDLFRQMNPRHVAPQSTFVVVYLNDQYQGLYLLSERLDVSTLHIDKGAPLAMIFKGPEIFRDTMPPPQFTDNFYHQKYPDIHKTDYTAYIKAFRELVTHPNDSLFDAQIGNWIDLNNVVDWHLLLLFTNNTDGLCKNFYLYKVNQRHPFRIAIWDYDHGLGRDGDNEYRLPQQMMSANRSVLLRRLLQQNTYNYRDRLLQRWHQLQNQNILTKANLERMIRQSDELIRSELPRNAAKWPLDSRWYFDDNSYEQEIALLHRFLDVRIEQMNAGLIRE